MEVQRLVNNLKDFLLADDVGENIAKIFQEVIEEKKIFKTTQKKMATDTSGHVISWPKVKVAIKNLTLTPGKTNTGIN